MARVRGVLLLLFFVLSSFVPALSAWPWCLLVPLAALGAVVAMVPPLGSGLSSWRWGRFSRPAVLAAIAITLLSSATLVVVHATLQPDASLPRSRLHAHLLESVLLAGATFALANALLEELIFRGVFFDAIESTCGSWAALVATTAFFGLAHVEGYPPGALGAILAGVFGFALGGLRMATGGLGLPILVHVAADATIFAIFSGAFG